MRHAALLLLAVVPALAQPKKLANAQLDTRSAASGLDATIRPLLNAQPQPSWIGYIVPAARGRMFGCDNYYRDGEFSVNGGTVHLEPPSELLVLLRVDANQVGRVRTMAPDCDIDAGGVPFHFLTDVQPAQSVAYLSTFVGATDRSLDNVMSAIGMHADPAADAALERFVAPGQPEQVRQRAVTWLGLTRSRRGFEVLKKLLAADTSERVRERAVETLSRSKEPEAIDLVIGAARNDASPRVRGQALTTLARQAGQKALGSIQYALDNDPEREVKRRAVSALQQMPNGEGIPMLIQVARNSKDADVRKQAMNSLGQSRDQRAINFFEEVLKAKP